MTERVPWYRRTWTLDVSVVRVLRWCVGLVIAAGLAAGVFYVARAPILDAIGRQLVHEDPLERVDLLVVLSGGMPVREIEAADLYKEGWATRILLPREPEEPATEALRTRGVATPGAYGERLALLEALGVPASAMVTPETLVRSTADEAALVGQWLQDQQQSVVIVVTSPSHTARARFVFTSALGDTTRVIMRGARSSPFDADTWWHDRITLREGLIEWQKSWWYWLRY